MWITHHKSEKFSLLRGRSEGRLKKMKRLDVSVIAGDGIGLEVIPPAIRAVNALGERFDFAIDWREYNWGSEYYLTHGRMMPVDGLDTLSRSDAIFLGAVGHPAISDVETLWGLLIPIRRQFQQYINLRPIRTIPGVQSPLRSDAAIDLVVVRENAEGEYSDIGGRMYSGQPEEAAFQQTVFTRRGVERTVRYAAGLALRRRSSIVSATKSNGIIHTMPFWDEVVQETLSGIPGIQLESVLIDALAARVVLKPESFDVIVASNLFGDILSDLAAAVVGSIGVAASGNLNPERRFPSMFEPVHGSAPDIAGKGTANPVGALWAASMMLDHLELPEAAAGLIEAFSAVLASGYATGDLGGTASTEQFTDAVIARITSPAALKTPPVV